MSWPIGYANPGFRFRTALDGAIFAQDIAVTDVNGWLDLRIPNGTSRPGMVDVSVRVRLSVDGHGHPFLYAEQVECEGRRYSGVHALIRALGTDFAEPIPRCLHAEIARRVAAGEPKPTLRRSERQLRATERERAVSKSPDDTWEPRPANVRPIR
jgi:hypothetical protein